MSKDGQIKVTDADMEAAMLRLDQLEAEEAGQDPDSTDPTSVTDDEPQHAAALDDNPEGSEPTSSENNTDTPATADEPELDPDKALGEDKADETKTETDDAKKGDEPEKPDRYTKARERASEEWKRINAEKEAFAREREAFQRQRDAFERKRNPRPEDLERNADQWQAELDSLELAAIRAERKADASGSQEDEAAAKQAKDAYEQAKSERMGLINLSRRQAKALRENPDPVARDADLRFKQEQGKWWRTAAEQFPQVAVKGSPVNEAARKVMQEDPEFAEHPKGLYLAARLATAETAAASVPVLKQELETLKARLKQIEADTSPSDADIPVTTMGERQFEDMGDDEQLSELKRMARAM